MALLKFSDFKKNRMAVRETKEKELANTQFNEKLKAKLLEMGVSSIKELSEEQMTALLDSLKPTKETATTKKVDEVEASKAVKTAVKEEEEEEDDDDDEKAEVKTTCMTVEKVCEMVHEEACKADADKSEETYENYMKKCSEAIMEKCKATHESKVNESKINEAAEVKDKASFEEYATAVLKKAFGDKFDEAKAKDVIDGISSKVKDDWGAAVGILQSSLGK